VWTCEGIKPDGTACDDGLACTSSDRCFSGTCGGTPGSTGPISGPTSSTTGSYTLSWTAACGATQYTLYENGVGIFNGGGQALSASIAGRGNGTYTYKVQGCSGSWGCGPFTPNFTVTVLLPPGPPGGVSAPPETGPSYTVSWGAASGSVDHYDLGEQYNGGAWTTMAVTTTSKAFTNKAYGSYGYQVRACNASGCSAYVSTSVSVTVITGLSALPDSPVVPPSMPIPSQGWVGTLPGAPGAEGGSATYRIPIEIPPGRAGMQPEVSLVYSSTSANGAVGVGWSVAGATSKISRCPRTLAQEGGSRPVLYDGNDRLCWDGQRLVAMPGAVYGTTNTEYRTEVDRFARIVQSGGGLGSSLTTFQIEHKSGRISQYDRVSPDTWAIAREYDRQGNCIAYTTSMQALVRNIPDYQPSSIKYTGRGDPASRQCSFGPDARAVTFTYDFRPDNRTTYRYSIGTLMGVRLKAISTSVGAAYVRRYQLSYHASAATGRSLLESVTLCAQPGGAVASCENVAERFPPTNFQYQEDAPNFDDGGANHGMWHATCPSPSGCGTAPYPQYAYGQALGNEWKMAIAGDLDGDGTRDAVYQSPNESWLLLSSCRTAQKYSGTSYGDWPVGFDHLVDGTYLQGFADVNNDGRVDIFGSIGGKLAFANATCDDPTLWPHWTTNLTLQQDGTVPLPWGMDYDGDGLLDLSYSLLHPPPFIGLRRNRSPLDWSTSVPWGGPSQPAGSSSSMSSAPEQTRDINGDGLVDSVFDDYKTPVNDTTTIAFQSSSQSYTYATVPALGGPSGSSFNPNSTRRWIDVNGDGLPDIYDPAGFIWINTGGPLGTQIFQPRPLTVPALDPNRTRFQFVMDIDSDGQEELLVPNFRVYDSCYEITGIPEPVSYCGAQFDTAPTQYRSHDKSVFVWDAYKFIEGSDGSYSMLKITTNLRAPTGVSVLPNDSNGDGTTDLYYSLLDVTNDYYNSTPSGNGPYITHNLMRAPDLLIKATNGLGSIASWRHRPLSNTAKAIHPVRDYDTEVGCDMPVNERFYVAHPPPLPTPPDPITYSDHAFFASSMWAVGRLDVSSGVGPATNINKTCYRYQDAMLNTEGRGFQGFKKIVVEEQMPPATGEPASSITGCGGTCSLNNRRTTSEFFQEFPLTNRLSKVTVAQLTAAGAQTLSETTYWWDVQPHSSAAGAFVVSGTGTVEKSYETSNALVRQKTTIVQADQASGEPVLQCAVSSGQAADSTHDVIVSDSRTYQNDLSIWWLTKLVSRTVLTDFGGGVALDGTCQLSGSSLPVGSCSRATPVCPTLNPTASAKTQTTNYFWFADNTGGSSRRLDHQDLVFQGATEASTAFQYDSFGNVSSKQVTARDVANDASYPPANTGLVTLTATTYVLGSDGYFVTTETNPLGHIASTTTDPATGLPTYHQSVQGGPATRMVYDPFGRLTTTTIDGQQLIEQRLSSCGVGDCAIKRQVFQSGSPIKTDYIDMLGRTIATGVEGFDGKEILTKVDYNARGAKVAEHQPISTGLPPGSWDGALASSFMTQYSGIDVLGRAGTKTVMRSSAPDLFEPGKGSANLVTTYAYNYDTTIPGLKTRITVFTPTTAAGQITMSRSYDPRGRLIQTVQQVSTPSSHPITTNYVWDPAGSLTDIIDSAQPPHDLEATYDDLGRKIRVDDPDRGTWLYTWDGLGRVRSQKDARGVSLFYQYDAIGRMERRFVQATSTSSILLEANWQYDLNGKPGTLSSMLGVIDGFRKDYKYDSLFRPWTMITTIPSAQPPPSGGGTWTARQFNVEYGYDHNYGRVKAVGFPSTAQGAIGEIARFDYKDPQGYPKGETPLDANGNPSPNGAFYRKVLSMSVRGQVVGQLFGNNVEEARDYDDSTGVPLWITATGLREVPPSRCATASAPLVRQLTYKYDHFLNLARQEKTLYQRDSFGSIIYDASCNTMNEVVDETYSYDELQRLLGATRSGFGFPTPESDTYTYDDLGNILSKSDKAPIYKYESSRPHAVTSLWNATAQLTTYAYDANGNMISGDGRTQSFDNVDRPISVNMTGVAINTYFGYAPDGTRYAQSGPAGTEYYVDKLYEYIVKANGITEELTHVSDQVEVVRTGSTRNVKYRHLDRLGSLEAATTDTATEDLGYSHGYDAFGKPRSRDWKSSSDKMNQVFERGFTGHEHLDDLYLIHMNGRIYDYRLGRFLSVDPIISNPANSQSINPYSYIGNNPLSGTDPTGYIDNCATYNYGPCSTIYYSEPQRDTSKTINLKIIENGGSDGTFRATLISNISLSAPMSGFMAPANIAMQGTTSGGGAQQMPPGALADMGSDAAKAAATTAPVWVPLLEKCASDWRCAAGALVVTGGAYLVWRLSGSPGESFPTATDATGALKPGEETALKPGEVAAPADAPKPEAGSGGAMSRGPGDPGRLNPGGAQEIGILRDAVKGQGNFGLGAADGDTAMRLGKAWVGPGANVASDGNTLVSKDGLRQFRPPSWKPNLGRVQANFESRVEPGGPWMNNGHLDIHFGPGGGW